MNTQICLILNALLTVPPCCEEQDIELILEYTHCTALFEPKVTNTTKSEVLRLRVFYHHY